MLVLYLHIVFYVQVKLDKVVNPKKTIADYRTDITGFTAKDLEGVTCSLDEVQVVFIALIYYVAFGILSNLYLSLLAEIVEEVVVTRHNFSWSCFT